MPGLHPGSFWTSLDFTLALKLQGLSSSPLRIVLSVPSYWHPLISADEGCPCAPAPEQRGTPTLTVLSGFDSVFVQCSVFSVSAGTGRTLPCGGVNDVCCPYQSESRPLVWSCEGGAVGDHLHEADGR